MERGILLRRQGIVSCFLKNTYIPLRTKLSISHLSVALFPALIISVISYTIYSNAILSETTKRMETLVTQTNQELDTSFDSVKTLLLASYSSSEIKEILYNPHWTTETPPGQKIEYFRRINDFFRGTLYLKNNISAIRFLPVQGISVIWYENGLILGYPHPILPWYQQIINADIYEAFIPPHRPLAPSSQNQNKVFSIGKAIRGTHGNIISIIMVDVKAAEIKNILNRASIVNNMQLAVINNAGRIIFGSKNLQKGKFLDRRLLQKIKSTPSGRLQYKINGENYLLMYETSKVSGWKLVTFTKINTLLKKANEVRVISLIIVILSIVVSLLFSILLSIKLTNPLKRLSSSMNQVKNRNFDVYLPISSNDEIGTLTQDFNGMVEKINHLIFKEYETDLRRKGAELKALESQINPHFLYNTLETINSIAYLKDVPEITTISRCLSELFRYSIDSTKKRVTLADELYHTSNYIEIQKIRRPGQFKVQMEIPESLLDYKVVKFIFQPFIENSITHGLKQMKSGGLIIISAELLENQTLIIRVKDNGAGIPPEKLATIEEFLNQDSDDPSSESNSFIGLGNVHFRIRHSFGENYGLTIESDRKTGTIVTIKLPAVK